MALAEILERNRAFLAGRASKPLPPPESIHQLILACYDPRLDQLLHDALGLDHGDDFLVRSAGAVVAPSGDPLRSIALAVYLFDVKAIAVVGHTSCRMAACVFTSECSISTRRSPAGLTPLACGSLRARFARLRRAREARPTGPAGSVLRNEDR